MVLIIPNTAYMWRDFLSRISGRDGSKILLKNITSIIFYSKKLKRDGVQADLVNKLLLLACFLDSTL